MWATSMGSTFSHRPVCGLRKSGIPDGTEIPAPVSATTGPAERMSSASRSAADVTATGGSPTLESRAPLLDERRDPLAGVLGRERLHEPLALGGEALVEVAGVGDGLDLLEGDRRLAGELPRPLERRVEQLVV